MKFGKIKYDRKVHVEFSTRRLEKNGYARTLWTWHKGGFLLSIGKDLKPKESYAKQKY